MPESPPMSPVTADAGGLRPAVEADIPRIAEIWHAGWHEAHAAILPVELTAARTRESFAPRLRDHLDDVRVLGPLGAPLGFVMLKGDELYQVYVAGEARGSGAAQALVADAERQLAGRGVRRAWLACAIGNARAERFYEKCGWARRGKVSSTLAIPGGECTIQVWRYEKELA